MLNVLWSQVCMCKKLNFVQIALSYSQPGMEVVRLGIELSDFKPKCSTKKWRQRVPANTYFDNNILFIIGCLMPLHSYSLFTESSGKQCNKHNYNKATLTQRMMPSGNAKNTMKRILFCFFFHNNV